MSTGPGNAGARALILAYHRVGAEICDPWALCVTPEHFGQQMAVLRQFVEVVPLMALENDVRTGALRAGTLALTFDDGYADNVRVALPILERHGVPATFFLVSGMIGSDREFWWDELDRLLLSPGRLPSRFEAEVAGTWIQHDLAPVVLYGADAAARDRGWRAWHPPPTERHRLYVSLWHALRPRPPLEQQQALDMLRRWAGVSPEGRPSRRAMSTMDLASLSGHALIDVGGHTDTHAQLSSLPAADQAEEIRRCRAELERWIDAPVPAVAYPFGAYQDYTAETCAVLDELGVRAACTTLQSFVVAGVDPLRLPRFTVGDWSGDEFAERLTGWLGGASVPRPGTKHAAGGAGRRPLVSIVTAFRDAEQFIEDAIHSVVEQSYDAWELLLIDDGSRDQSTALARHYAATYPDRVHYFEHDGHANIGAAASRNVGVRASRGVYVAVLDADDTWLPDKLGEQVALLEAAPDVAMVCSASLHWHSWTGRPEDRDRDMVEPLGVATNRRHDPPGLVAALYPLGPGGAPCPSNVLLRRAMLDPGGGFEEAFVGPYQLYEDQAFLMKIYLEHRVLVADALWDKYRIHSGSCVSSVMAAGQYGQVRKFFLDWFTTYLDRRDNVDPAVRAALRSALDEYAPPMTIDGTVSLASPGWTLRTDHGSAAALTRGPDPGRLLVAIDSPPTALPWDVQINHPRLAIVAHNRYVVRCRAKAVSSRTVRLGVAMAIEPWDSLGLYATIALTPEWVEVAEVFTATRGASNGRVHIDLGGASGDVEVCAVTIGPA
jgi:peptidoglycan/xylan/chitin deacetylase (PgdA/CDA1 family)/glycosyltransferase involved in cell wall biosynthesis